MRDFVVIIDLYKTRNKSKLSVKPLRTHQWLNSSKNLRCSQFVKNFTQWMNDGTENSLQTILYS